MFNTNREVEFTYMGGTKTEITKIVDGRLSKVWDTGKDHRLLCIYKIQGHRVNLKEICEDKDSFRKARYRVTYLLLHSIEEVIEGEFIHASDNYRTMWFTNPKHPEGKLIGIPIMNIVSCVKITEK